VVALVANVGREESTTEDAGAATIAAKIGVGVRRLTPEVREPSVRTCSPLPCRLDIMLRPRSRSRNPSVWLEDYQLACHNGGASNDLFIIKSIPLYLTDSARA
jgi:hypothetical protein